MEDTKTGEVNNFKKFIQGRCMTLLNKANELYRGYVNQNYSDVFVCVLIDDGRKKLVYTSSREQWPFNFQVPS
jgi:hypothetical protein